jgi:putative spermidine/putrescine transport system ATP-binding protein
VSVRADLTGVSVRFGSVQALDGVDLTVEPGQFLALLGPSGSGKTTTLNVLAGFVHPDSGAVLFDGEDVTRVPPHRRELGIVFQGYALFPHMSVEANVDFPLRMRKLPRDERRQRVSEALALVGLDEHATRTVDTLSGGQQQRVALARAIIFEPRMMLLDEPLAALDKHLREAMQLELRRLQQRVGITTVAVTHDQVEALTMADRVAVMCDGHVEQVASPEELYLRPATFFVATFLGEANLVPVERGELAGFGRLPQDVSGQAVIRPEHLTLQEDGPGTECELTSIAQVEEVTFQGPRRRARVRLRPAPDIVLTFAQPSTSAAGAVEPGSEVTVALDASAVHVIPGEPTRSGLPGETVLSGNGAP